MPKVELPDYEGDVVERIDKSQLPSLNDFNHDHDFQPDYEDETDSYLAYICQKPGCGLGYLQAK